MTPVYPDGRESLPHATVFWDEPLVRRRKGVLHVWVLCECGSRRLVPARDIKRKRLKTGWCHRCSSGKEFRPAERRMGPAASRFVSFRRQDRSGYVYAALYPGHPLYESMGGKGRHGHCRYVGEHRLVMAEHLGRPLRRWEHVHHKDKDRRNNAIDNLELVDGKTHAVITGMESEIERIRADLGRLRAAALPACAALVAGRPPSEVEVAVLYAALQATDPNRVISA
jgi:hypothetical protein